MSARKLERMKGRRQRGSFSVLPHDIFQSEEYAELKHRARSCLIDLICQFRGSNNGDLTAAWSIMKKRGWTSKDQLAEAIKELRERGWIIVSRQSTKRREPNLYALTWLGVDPCGGKLDIAADPVPSGLWKRERRAPVIEMPKSKRQVRTVKSLARHTGQYAPPHGATIGGQQR